MILKDLKIKEYEYKVRVSFKNYTYMQKLKYENIK